MNVLNLGFFLVFGAILWFFMLKPEMDKKKEHEALLASLAKDDLVVTNSGLHGKVVSVSDATLLLGISDKTRVTIDKSSVARRQGEPASA